MIYKNAEDFMSVPQASTLVPRNVQASCGTTKKKSKKKGKGNK